MGKQELTDSNNVYYRSYLKKAGIRFDYSIVDTTVKRGLGLSFYVAVLIFAACSLWEHKSELLATLQWPLLILSLLYILCYIARYAFFISLRRKLRATQDPILAEAYAVVLLDSDRPWPLPAYLRPRLKSAVIYKECGTLKPRFFLGVASRRAIPGFVPHQLVQVFTDKRRPKFYSVDDESAVKALPAGKALLRAINLKQSLGSGAEMRSPGAKKVKTDDF